MQTLALLEKILSYIEDIRDELKEMTFEDACEFLAGYNYDGNLFGYDMILDSEHYMIGTIENDNGKPVMNKGCIYELWEYIDFYKREQVLAMTEQEIREQIDELLKGVMNGKN